MAREPLEYKPEVSEESIKSRLGDNVVQQLFKELSEMGPNAFGDGPRPPGESALMAGVSPEQGTARMQGVVDEGVRATPALYERGGSEMRSGGSGGDTQVAQHAVDSNVQHTPDLYRGASS